MEVVSKRGGHVACQRLTFSAWANDDSFYERLVDGDVEAVAIYQRCMILVHECRRGPQALRALAEVDGGVACGF